MTDWQTICPLADIPPNSGRCALVGKQQVAIFRVALAEGEALFAIDNHDPFSGANVLSRGIVGNLDERIVVASPLYKQHFCLRTGECLEDNIQLRTWAVRLQGDNVQLAA